MLMQPVTASLMAKWRRIYDFYRPHLRPNNRSGDALVQFLQRRYPTIAGPSPFSQIVLENLYGNAFYREKLPCGVLPRVTSFVLAREGTAQALYDRQDACFAGQDIWVGIACNTGFFHVEGSSLLWDELFAYRGLDAMDLNHPYLVAESIGCLSRFGLLEPTLHNAHPMA